MLTQHLADCLAVIPPLQPPRRDRAALLDVGSGGGLPGVVIATLLPGWDVTCVDAVAKKAAFMRQVAGALALPNLHAVHSRVERLRAAAFRPDHLARLRLARRLHRAHPAPPGTRRRLDGDEGQGARRRDRGAAGDVEVFHVEPLQVPGLDAQRCLVWMQPKETPHETPAACSCPHWLLAAPPPPPAPSPRR